MMLTCPTLQTRKRWALPLLRVHPISYLLLVRATGGAFILLLIPLLAGGVLTGNLSTKGVFQHMGQADEALSCPMPLAKASSAAEAKVQWRGRTSACDGATQGVGAGRTG